jgi:hypothetical protein
MKDNLHEFFTSPWVAAAAGSILGLKALPGASLWERLCNVAAGFAIAAFVGPGLIDAMGWTSPRLAALAIFGLGATGLVIFSALLEAFRRSDIAAALFDGLKSFLPGRKRGDQ